MRMTALGLALDGSGLQGWIGIKSASTRQTCLSIESLHNSFGLAIGRNISYFGEFSPLSFYYGLGCWSLLC